MATQHPCSRLRNRVLASGAMLGLVAAGAIGEGALSQHSVAAPLPAAGLSGPSMPSFAPLIDRVKPAVVSVKVKIVQSDEGAQGGGFSERFGSLPPEIQKFFAPFGEHGIPSSPQSVMWGEGSGFFISSDGYVVTNNHVVDHAKSVTVTMDDGKVLDAKVVGTDPKTDLALLKVDQPGDYPYVQFAKSAPKIGDWVLAIGNPYGLGGTVTAGIISAKGRDIGDGPYDRFLQIDAPMNKGNSGGPTFNEDGQVVGVNTAIYSPSGGSVGIGFAIPSGTVERVVTALEHGGVVQRGYLGVEIQSLGPDMAEALGLKEANGAHRRQGDAGHACGGGGPRASGRDHQGQRRGGQGRRRPDVEGRADEARGQGRPDVPAQRRREDGQPDARLAVGGEDRQRQQSKRRPRARSSAFSSLPRGTSTAPARRASRSSASSRAARRPRRG